MKNLLKIILIASIFMLNFSCKKTADDCVCIEIYEPVCGEDGKIYGNSCKAECAGVTYSAGVCPIEVNAKIIDTGPVPVDGCDWVIQFEVDGVLTEHHADNLPANFQINELDVKITYKSTLENFVCGLLPTTMPKIDLVEIELI